jgi:hypothetical protein
MALDSRYSYTAVLPRSSPFLNPTVSLKEHEQDHYQFIFDFLDNLESEVASHTARTTQSLVSMRCQFEQLQSRYHLHLYSKCYFYTLHVYNPTSPFVRIHLQQLVPLPLIYFPIRSLIIEVQILRVSIACED